MLGKIKMKIVVVALFAAVLTFISQSSVAYYQTVGKATNVVTSGDIQMKIVETTSQGTPFPEDGVYITPGDVVSKEVNIESQCNHPFYLRVKIVYGVNSTELPAEDCFKLNINEEYWEFHNGWYYYKTAVEPGQTTPDVFSQVEIVGEKVNSGYLGKILNLTVKAHAVQSENNPLENGKTYTASGWPAE